ncbi:MAG: type II toxin-antitoxin system VapC family toxin [Acetatifactor sp.]|nr:type II toxin-antitoxin system VapC family toxin [Acetatifactor sp.]MDE7045171.1 type II toxin-antitoxin system VapC family toxin [Acetatifactor sp.]
MKYMLDTNTCMYAIKREPDAVIKKFLVHDSEEMCISAITYAELIQYTEQSTAVGKSRVAMSLFLYPITILEFDVSAAEACGRIQAELEKAGISIDPMDMMIAGHAKSRGLILVTDHAKEYRRVEGLAVEDWTRA